MNLTARLRVALGVWAVLTIADGARAQSIATFRGQVFDSLGQPLTNVQVTLREGPYTAATDSTGRFSFPRVSPALYHVSLRKLGYQPITGTARIRVGDALDLRFRMRAITVQLDTVRSVSSRLRSEFDLHRAAGFGTFLTDKDLEAWPGTPLKDLIRAHIAGVEFQQFQQGRWAAFTTRGSGFGCGAGSLQVKCSPASDWPDRCYMQIIVDGSPAYEYTADNTEHPIDLGAFSPTDLAGIEIYRGPGETPLEFGGTGAACGTIVIWTKSGGGKTRSEPDTARPLTHHHR